MTLDELHHLIQVLTRIVLAVRIFSVVLDDGRAIDRRWLLTTFVIITVAV